MLIKLSQVYLKLQDEHNIPAADFPDVDVMREKLKKYKPVSISIRVYCKFQHHLLKVRLQQVLRFQQITDCKSGPDDLRGLPHLFGFFNCQLSANHSVQDVPRIMSLIPAEDIKKKSAGGGLIQGGVFEKVLNVSLL